MTIIYLFRAPLNTAVLAGHVFTVPMVCSSTCKTEVRVTLSNSQVAWTLLGVALSFAPASRKAVLTFGDKFVTITTISSNHHLIQSFIGT